MPGHNDTTRCPDCGAVLDLSRTYCAACGLPIQGEVAAQLWHVELRLAMLHRERDDLIQRHSQLLGQLRMHKRPPTPAPSAAPQPGVRPPLEHPAAPVPVPHSAGGAPSWPPAPPRPAAPPPQFAGAAAPPPARPSRPRWELTAVSVRNIVLAIGGLLLAIAAVAFTVITWSDLSIGARAAVLVGATALTGYLPRPLHRHGMAATAETVGALAAVLLGLDAFALWTIAKFGAMTGFGYFSLAGAVIALTLAAYPRFVPLQGPRVLALLLAQTVPFAAAMATTAPETWLGAAFLATALGDLLLMMSGRVRRAVLSGIAMTCGLLAWALGVLWAAGWFLLRVVDAYIGATAEFPPIMSPGIEAPVLFAAAGGIALLAAWRWRSAPKRDIAVGAAAACWIAVPPAAPSGVLPLQPESVMAVWALAVLAAALVLPLLSTEWRTGPLVVVGVSLVPVSIFGLSALAPLGRQVAWAGSVWQGSLDVPAAAGPEVLPAALTAAAAGAGWTALLFHTRPRNAPPVALGTGILIVVLAVQWLPHTAAVAVLTAASAALLGIAVVASRAGSDASVIERAEPSTQFAKGHPASAAQLRLAATALVLSLLVGTLALIGALVTDITTLLVLCALLLAATAGAAAAGTVAAVRASATAAAVAAATGAVLAATLMFAAPPLVMALSLLAVAAAVVGVATGLDFSRVRADQVRTLDITAALPALAAAGAAAVGGRDLLALVLALAAFLALLAATHSAAREGRGGLAVLALLLIGSAPLLLADRLALTVAGSVLELAIPWESGSTPLSLPVPDLPVLPLALVALGAAGAALTVFAAWRCGRAAAAATALAVLGAATPLVLMELPVRYGPALVILVLAAGVLLMSSAGLSGWRGHAVLWTGLAVGGMAAGWSSTSPDRTLAVLGALSAIGIAAAALRGALQPVRSIREGSAAQRARNASAQGRTDASVIERVKPSTQFAKGHPASAAQRARNASAQGRTDASVIERVKPSTQFAEGHPSSAVQRARNASAQGRTAGKTDVRASRVLTFAAAVTAGATLLVGYAAFEATGLPLDPRWQAFTGLAGAAAAAGIGRLPLLANRPEQRGALAAAGLALVLIGTVVGAGVPDTLALVAGTAALVSAALAGILSGRLRWAPTAVSGAAVALAAALAVPVWATAMFAPFSWLGAAWEGGATLSRPASETLLAGMVLTPLPPESAAALVLVGLGALALVRLLRRSNVAPTAAALAVPVLGPLPAVLNLPTWSCLAWLAALSAVLLYLAAGSRPAVARIVGSGALGAALIAAAWALAEAPLTLVALVVIVLLAVGYQVIGQDMAVVAGAAATATLATGGFAVALLFAFGQPAEVAALGLVAVIAGAAGVAAAASPSALTLLTRSAANAGRPPANGVDDSAHALTLASVPPSALTLPHPVVQSIEASAAVSAVAAVGLTLSNPERLELTSLTLAALGIIALGSALRADRRWLAGVGAVLLLAALWVLLGWLRIAEPEPYLLPLALAALALGWEWRRRLRAADRPPPSSWLAFGPGLSLAFLPTLAMLYLVETDPVRLALLGAAALAGTLSGAQYRMQAPLLISGLVLLLVGQRAFGTPLWELTVALPTWIPVGAAGLLLVFVGARFERNLRDLRRIGQAIGAME